MVCLAAGPVFVDGGLHAYSCANTPARVRVCVWVSYFGKREGGGRRKRGTRVAIMLAWKSWKRGPEGQPLLPTFRVQTIAICLVAAGVMQRAPSAIRPVLPVKVINKRLVSVFLFLALSPPSSLSLSLSSHPPLCILAAAWTGLERGDVLRKQGQLSSLRIYERLRNFSARWNSRPGWKRVQRAEEL